MKIQQITIPIHIKAERKNKTVLSTIGRIIGFGFSLLLLYAAIILFLAMGGPV